MNRGVGFGLGLFLMLMPCLSAQEGNVQAVAKLSSGAAVADTTSQPNTPQLQQRDNRYHLAAGDSFDVSFELSPEFNQTVAIQPDGFVTLKAVGDVKVLGQTLPELTQTLRTAYSKMLNDPLIVVVLKDFEKPYFIADGQVTHPGRYDMRGTVTLTEAVAIAGGFTENAKHSQVILFRRVNDQWLSAKIFNVKEMQRRGDLHEDPTLKPGDMLIVPKNLLSKIKPFIPNAGMGAYKQIP
ncbi:MAG: polysaccharide export protein [Candidatus Sulfotelmatobacter sp.]|nr:polysaccharide export protein [Candidatus Sulfotelmatobacter sp.]